MKRILILNLPYTGHVNPTLGLAKELVNRGYEVGYINEGKWRERIEVTGVKFIPFKDYPEDISSFKRNFECYKAAYDTALAVGKDYDILIYENWFYLGKVLAEELKIPTIKLFATSALNTNVINKEILNKSPIWFHMRYKLIRKLITKLTAKGIKINHKDMLEEMGKSNPDANIVYTVKEFQVYPEEFDERFHFVGPSIQKYDSGLQIPFDNMKYPIIYVSFGTQYNRNIRFFKKCIKAFENKEYIVIMTTGNGFDKKKLGKLASNIYVYSFVQQYKVLEKASLFISHGGQNSVNESMYNGVPMLVSPQGFDQQSNADMVEYLKLGRRINSSRISSNELYNIAMKVMNDEKIAMNTNKMKGIMGHTNADKSAADITENYINFLTKV